ncbi:MAG: 5,10-methylenetetrahydrofolate reductase [Candidatus Muiribacterium halophilum]|uniref:5,10-methylenetetrahydrofolate reductase n=1 Tax=Muiribacterium halophilum TaxID=2053465 RepID=A0A2N5ZLU1_MUIH1|nr:MAG: 5,10-methylenetetrahydrofolate reductase [Candidatus Muirbacterium halophilum]
MIITRFKDPENIEKIIKSMERVVLIGCGVCALDCGTSGDEILEKYTKIIEEKGKIVAGTLMIDGICNEMLVKRELKKIKELDFDSILVFSCGSGVQVLSMITGKPIHTFLDTVYLARKQRAGHFREACVMCGDCVLNDTANVCPRTQCPKGITNGPCGGSVDGKCEVDPEKDCAWVLIYTLLAEKHKEANIEKIFEPQKYINDLRPRKDDV